MEMNKSFKNGDGYEKIDFYVFGFQEINEFIVFFQYMIWIYVLDSIFVDKWKVVLGVVLLDGYQFIVMEQFVVMLFLVYVFFEVVFIVSNVSIISVVIGVFGYFGNKGVVCVCIVFGEVINLLFVNCYFVSGVENFYIE